jgi:S-adenosylmethionine decarboxylase proenzyme
MDGCAATGCNFNVAMFLQCGMDGLHITADFKGCQGNAALLTDAALLRTACMDAIAQVGLRAVGELFHSYGNGAGVTGVVLLAESHLALHTWPELNAATLDVYVCNFGQDNSSKAEHLINLLTDAFKPAQQGVNRLQRGAVGHF